MITDVNYGLSLQLTCQLINLSTRQLQIMITEAGKNKMSKTLSTLLIRALIGSY